MSAGTTSSLSPQSHLTRPRTRSINTDHSKLLFTTASSSSTSSTIGSHQDPSPSPTLTQSGAAPVTTPPSTTTRSGRPLSFTRPSPSSKSRSPSPPRSPEHLLSGVTATGPSIGASGSGSFSSTRPHFPLLPSSMPVNNSSPPHSRQHSQTTLLGSSSSSTPATTDSSFHQHNQHILHPHPSGMHLSLDPSTSSSAHRHESARLVSNSTPPLHLQHSTSLGSSAKIDHNSATSHKSDLYTSSSSSAVNHGSHSNIHIANSNSSISTLISNSPLQHRPHTPLKSSFPTSVTSDNPSDHSVPVSASTSASIHLGGGGGGGGGGVGGGIGMGTHSSSGHSYETTTPMHFKSLSTKTGRSHYADNEKQLGSLPTIHHQGRGGRQETPTFLGVSMKHLSLVVLLLQNSVLVLMMRYSRVSVGPDQPMYLASTAVFLAEIIKLCTCTGILAYRTQSIPRTIHILRNEVLGQPRELLKMLIPSGLYALQNNLLYIALSNLEAATFQVTYQLKILSTAIFSVVMLNRRLTKQKWLSLCLLMLGVTLVQLQNVGTPKSPVVLDTSKSDEGDSDFLDSSGMGDELDSSPPEDDSLVSQNPIIGLFAVLTSCISSGFAGCYFEKILKGSESDMWVRNLQLGVSGSLFSFLAMFYDRQKIYDGGMFQGYSLITWCVITNQALGGLLVAIVVKYADNILKGFATSLSIIISGMISVYFFDFEPSIQFQMGTLVVILATFLYGRPDAAIPRFIRPQKK
ncbi:MAG: nucleotide-sugar transporter-domain-containing protein [Linnemannia elongata]|nr:MAG: nucleotide-sugar transporter-domain-containing protein [Linnemannia elongata]